MFVRNIQIDIEIQWKRLIYPLGLATQICLFSFARKCAATIPSSAQSYCSATLYPTLPMKLSTHCRTKRWFTRATCANSTKLSTCGVLCSLLHFKSFVAPKGPLRLSSSTNDEVVESWQPDRLACFQSISSERMLPRLFQTCASIRWVRDRLLHGGQECWRRGIATLSTCGVIEQRRSLLGSIHPDMRVLDKPRCKVTINGRSLCTAWRVGPDNHMQRSPTTTVSHQNQKLRNTEVWFNHQRRPDGSMATTVKVMGVILSTDYDGLHFFHRRWFFKKRVVCYLKFDVKSQSWRWYCLHSSTRSCW